MTILPFIERRALLGLAAAVSALPGLARAGEGRELESMEIWPGQPPGGDGVTVTESVIARTPGGDPDDTAFLNVRRPRLMMRRPTRPNGAALLMIPGGGYRRVAVSRKGGAIDAWIASLGVTAFVMTYRLPADGWVAGPDVALQDAQRAMRLIRAKAPALGLDRERVGVVGFSAGGHIAARLATRFEHDAYDPVDEADALSTRPAAAGLFYPVITLTEPYAHTGSVTELLGTGADTAARLAVSAEQHVPVSTPPVFIAAAADDRVVPVENSLMMWEALRRRGIASEMHLFEIGGHGFGLGGDMGAPLAPWPGLLDAFLKRHDLY